MNAYTVSHLAHDAGVSVNVVRDYVLRDLLHPAQRTQSGYRLYDAQALERLRFVRAAFEAGIGLDEFHGAAGRLGDIGPPTCVGGSRHAPSR